MRNNKNLEKTCYLCENKIDKVDYKDHEFLRRFLNSQGKIYPPRRFGTCAKHQRILTRALKRARVMALVPFVIK